MQIAVQNRKAKYNYTFVELFEAGIELQGSEIKSLRNGRVEIAESYAREDNSEIFLINSHFSKYSNASYLNHVENRPRKLLLHKKEIRKIIGKLNISYNENIIGEYDLLAANDVKKVNIFSRLMKSINYLIWGDV